MTGSAWVDVIVIGIALLAAISGYRSGAVASALAFIGVALGAVAGLLLAPHLIERFDDLQVRVLVGIAVLVVLVVIGEVAGMVLGRAARGGIRSPGLRAIDSGVGSILQVVAVLLAAGLLAIPLRGSADPAIAGAVRDSKVLTGVEVLSPQWVNDLPGDFKALLDSSGLPKFPFVSTPSTNVDPPDPALADLPVVRQARPSVVKIEGVAPSCRQALEGSGFVVSPERVMTNAHVVAGTERLEVETSTGARLPAKVVLFDSDTDIAVLDVPGLRAPALRFASRPASTGDDAIALGFPEAGPFYVSPLRVRSTFNHTGDDIYRSGQVTREVYAVRGSIRQGNSGGPLLNSDGEVLGVVFGAAENVADETGFVLTARQVRADFDESERRSERVSTKRCVLA
ncbi:MULTISPECIES: MarP family serine protease [Gordonia]|uniref:Serine protease n=1 Tax=Gordonia alkanivorans CGMCC 6845 TaxID=1423140 RepID=W9DKA9_9ACTN|nr:MULTISPECIES: MarP family serine protease [Gordonia]ETA07025.1 serine protease [Gordonia alkanivorans CGMCC 6845]MDH3007122.1 MarP family serine protease [Gordonia alkanivorans]MDH3013683.1 MarP family serine protease [Gordonia alkanivorans]MDH3017075.1 MarP family serine protease [Gordonia alkanivorans]MDH3021591.1 MarP family serine protease [Gordonia alkanivorans]